MPANTICPPATAFNPVGYETSEILQDPYQEHTEQVSRFSADVPQDVLLKFKAIMPHRGAIQATVNTLLYGLMKEFSAQGINNYDPTYKDKIVKIIKTRAFGEHK